MTLGDPALVEQAENRKGIDAMLGKHGWRMGQVRVREKGMVIAYELVRLSDGKTVEEEKSLSDIVMWGIQNPDVSLVMLGLTLLVRVKNENKVSP